jgi:hypothetical protein
MSKTLTKEEWKSLWGILWRVLVFGPILFPIGAILFSLVVALLLFPPCYAVLAIATGDILLGLAVAAVWLVLLRLTLRLRRKLFEGIEYAGI